MIPQLAFVVCIRTSVEKIMYGGLIYYALKHKRHVAAKYGNGTFELVATGDSNPQKKLK